MIGIIDYGSGNVKAIANIYKKLNLDYFVTKNPDELDKADRLILPGVGAFDQTMNLLNKSGLRKKLDQKVLTDKLPILGICVGMQIMAESSAEGNEEGLKWFDGKVLKIDAGSIPRKPRLPHMGWNEVNVTKENLILENINSKKGFYFLHSYYVLPQEADSVLATVNYGNDLTCVIRKENIIGIQFHPEKSHDNGIQIFKNFARI